MGMYSVQAVVTRNFGGTDAEMDVSASRVTADTANGPRVD
jgi:hypothetical protein